MSCPPLPLWMCYRICLPMPVMYLDQVLGFSLNFVLIFSLGLAFGDETSLPMLVSLVYCSLAAKLFSPEVRWPLLEHLP